LKDNYVSNLGNDPADKQGCDEYENIYHKPKYTPEANQLADEKCDTKG